MPYPYSVYTCTHVNVSYTSRISQRKDQTTNEEPSELVWTDSDNTRNYAHGGSFRLQPPSGRSFTRLSKSKIDKPCGPDAGKEDFPV
jgi:hypothetical protein